MHAEAEEEQAARQCSLQALLVCQGQGHLSCSRFAAVGYGLPKGGQAVSGHFAIRCQCQAAQNVDDPGSARRVEVQCARLQKRAREGHASRRHASRLHTARIFEVRLAVIPVAGCPLWEILAAGEWRSPKFLAYLDMHKLEMDAVMQAHLEESTAE